MNELVKSEELLDLPQEQPEAAGSMIALIDRAVHSRDVDIEKMRALLDMQKEIIAHEAKAKYMEAMAKFGGLKKNIKHNRKGTTAGNATFTYADYPSMVKDVTPWLHECGLSFSHREDPPVMAGAEIGYVMVYCTIKHIAGHSEEFHFPAMPDNRLKGKVSPSQLIQMAITYAKRQTLAMGLGLATAEDANDDDSTDPVEPITEHQAANLQAMIDETKADKAGFLRYLSTQCKRQIKDISEIPSSAFDLAVKGLEKKRRQQ